MKKIIQINIALVLVLFSHIVYALDCEPLDPRQQVGKKADKSIEGSAKTIFKIIEGEVKYKNKTEEEVKNLYQNYPNADKLVLKGKLIYTFCTILNDAKDLDSNEKLLKLNAFINTILSTTLEPENKLEKSRKRNAIVENDEFIFELKQCKGTSSAIKCSFLITNIAKDRPLRLYGKYGSTASRIFLENGDEIPSYKSRLGSSENNQYTTSTLLTGIPIKATVYFKMNGNESNKISAIDLRANKSSIQFRNVTIK